MEDMELTIVEGESLKIKSYIQVQGRNVEKGVFIWRTKDNELHISIMNERGTDDLQIVVNAKGIEVKDLAQGEDQGKAQEKASKEPEEATEEKEGDE